MKKLQPTTQYKKDYKKYRNNPKKVEVLKEVLKMLMNEQPIPAEYKPYMLLGEEETICLTNADFACLQEFFQFNGLPHYETITPDCRRVCDNLRISGYHNFYNELERVLEKLK